jgi:hypothetical protein
MALADLLIQPALIGDLLENIRIITDQDLRTHLIGNGFDLGL